MYFECADSWRRISVTALHDFSSDELEYFEYQYPEDLEHVFALLGAEISLVIFTRAMHPPHIRKWTKHFPLSEHNIDFLFCLFLHILTNQSLDLTGQSFKAFEICSDRSGKLAQPPLQGFLATSRTAISPFFLLVSAAFWTDSAVDTRKKYLPTLNYSARGASIIVTLSTPQSII